MLTFLAGLMMIAVVMILAAAVVAFALVIRGVFWLLLLPFKLLFWAVSLIGGALLFLVIAIAIAIPLLPLVFVAFIAWALVRLMKRPLTT